MDKTYSPEGLETRWYTKWKQAGYFAPSGKGEPYCIVIPPPNVTGTLHMGHAFQYTIMDALIRFQRMSASNTLWQPGMDHAGIATQMVVERQLNSEGKTRQEIGREAFVERVWAWKDQSGDRISRQLERLGASVDWSRERFTMDEDLSAAVIEVFVRLYDDGLIYRGHRLVNWDPVLHTALSDLEVQSVEESGHLWHFRYPLSDGSGHVVVATTRPETMLGDTAVAVHPDDERYRHLVGGSITLPIAEREIPVVADQHVDPEFGSGCVKITPGHDFDDFEVGQRHNLAVINIFDDDARLNDQVPDGYRGLDRFEARDRVVAAMKRAGLLERIQPHNLTVPRGDRSGAVLEPYLTDQWYVKIAPLAEPAIAAVEDGRIRFVPENWAKTYFEWMRNVQDWCISRQLWWGHRIPAWYDDQGQVYVAKSEAELRRQHALDQSVSLRRDEDVLDTWFSSALWPFSTLGWPKDDPALRTFYPTTVLVTGFDIIFFWVARMIMMGLKFAGDVPFREVYIHGLIRDQDGQKMSKSKGNILDPLDLVEGVDLEILIEKRTSGLMQPQLAPKIERTTREQFPQGIAAYGTDALRFTFAALATTGRDIRFDLGRVEGYRNFCNKLWNAARYVLMNTEDISPARRGAEVELGLPEKWIRSRLSRTIRAVHDDFARYRLDLVAAAIYDFVWREYCDWYLELSKPVLQSEGISDARRLGTKNALLEVLDALLRLLHPVMPFITEEIWQRTAERLGAGSETIMLAAYPRAEDFETDDRTESEMCWIMDFILGIRQIRGEMDIARSHSLPVLLQNASGDDLSKLDTHKGYLMELAGLASIEPLAQGETPPASAAAFLGDMQLLVPMEGVIDVEAEHTRLSKRRTKTMQALEKSEKKLANTSFLENAPGVVVDKERDRVTEMRREISQLEEQIKRVETLR